MHFNGGFIVLELLAVLKCNFSILMFLEHVESVICMVFIDPRETSLKLLPTHRKSSLVWVLGNSFELVTGSEVRSGV